MQPLQRFCAWAFIASHKAKKINDNNNHFDEFHTEKQRIHNSNGTDSFDISTIVPQNKL